MKRVFILAAAAVLIATPISLAQTTPAPATPPAATQTPTPTPEPATPPATTPSTETPGAPSAPGTTPSTPPRPSNQTNSSAAEPQGCRTRMEAGEPCACISDPSRVGTSTAHPDGHNVCVRAE